MIISHHHKFIFIAVPRTASHTLRAALRPYLHSGDWEQCVLFESKRSPVKSIARLEHGHITCRQIQPVLYPPMWTRFYKFCFVRNPYDRFVSLCAFWQRKTQQMKIDPLGTMKYMIRDQAIRDHIFFQPQVEFITDQAGQLLVDYVGRYENLAADVAHVFQQLDLPLPVLTHRNASHRLPHWRGYDQELAGMVRAVYAQDFDLYELLGSSKI